MPAGRIGIGADRPARACAAEQMAFVRLADDNIRRRKVEQDRRPRQRGHGAGRIGRPEILTNLDAKGEPRQIVRGEDQIGTERYLTGAAADRQADAFAAMREPALFVIFAIVGQEALGYHAEQFAPRDDQRAIVDPAIAAQRCSEDQHRAKLARGGDDRLDLRFDRIEQCELHMQIVDRIGRQRQFGIEQEVDMLRMRLVRGLENTLGIIGDVGCAHLGRTRREANEAMRVHVVEGMRRASAHGGGTFLIGWCRSRFEPVGRLANAQFGQPLLDGGARDLALRLPAIDGPAWPRLRLAEAHTELFRTERRVLRFAPLAYLEAGQMHGRRGILLGYPTQVRTGLPCAFRCGSR